jgi:hypothetical protein
MFIMFNKLNGIWMAETLNLVVVNGIRDGIDSVRAVDV